MISDRERREAARELRAMDMTDIEENGRIIDSPKYVGLLLMRMLDAVCDYRPGLHYFPSHFSAQAVVELFADLIDRPTCRYAYDHSGSRVAAFVVQRVRTKALGTAALLPELRRGGRGRLGRAPKGLAIQWTLEAA